MKSRRAKSLRSNDGFFRICNANSQCVSQRRYAKQIHLLVAIYHPVAPHPLKYCPIKNSKLRTMPAPPGRAQIINETRREATNGVADRRLAPCSAQVALIKSLEDFFEGTFWWANRYFVTIWEICEADFSQCDARVAMRSVPSKTNLSNLRPCPPLQVGHK